MSLPTDIQKRPKKKLWHQIYHIYNIFSGLAFAIAVLSIGLVWLLSPEGTVVVASDLQVISKKVEYKGNLRYSLDINRLKSCPGIVVYTFTHQPGNAGPANTVVFRRPVAVGRIGKQEDSTISLPLPESVFPGTWLFTSAVESQCPRHTQVDHLTSFMIDVVRGPVDSNDTVGG